MGKIITIKGDLLEAPEPYIAHGCNSKGVMNSGVAKLIRAKWGRVFVQYEKLYYENGLKLGHVQTVFTGDKIVCNCITQKDYGRENKIYCDYKAIRKCMKKLNKLANGRRVAMPKIGAGLAQGDWVIIKKIIEEEFTISQPVVYVI